MSQHPEPIEHVAAAPVPTRLGQATAVEQSRAVAEVQAAIVVAQQVPRHIDTARSQMQASCAMLRLAEKAFYQYPRGGQKVTGASVYLARELARCWGNVQYGISELRRDDEHGESEMQAWAWDVQTNARSSQTFIVPHKRDKKGGPEKLVDLRDIYENNANMGARRLREAIFSILPPWFVEEAKEICVTTMNKGDGRPLPERIDGAIKAFEGIGVTREQLEQKLGRASDKWTAYDIAQLLVTHRSLQRGELIVDEEFPQPRVTRDEITAGDGGQQAPPEPTPEPPAENGQVDQRPPTQAMNKKLFKLLADIDVGDDKRHAWAARQLGREVESFSDLTRDDVNRLIDVAEGTAAMERQGGEA